jgi:hypothetical protein
MIFFIHKFVNAIRVFVNVKRAQFVWALKKLLCAEAPSLIETHKKFMNETLDIGIIS